MPVVAGMIAELGALDGVSDLSGSRAAGVVGVAQDRSVQERLNERVDIGEKPLTGVIRGTPFWPQVTTLPFTTFTNRGDPSALRRSSETGTSGALKTVVLALLRRVADHAELPDVVRTAIEEHALRFKVISKVGNGVYALRNP